MSTANLVLRTVYLSPSMDDKLRDEAYFTRTSKNDLIQRYIEAGMKALAAQGVGGVSRLDRPATKKTGATKEAVASARSMAAKKVVAAKKATGPKRAAVSASTKSVLSRSSPV